MAKFLTSGQEVSMKVVKIVMYYAPIGLGCYFATVVGELGPKILQGYARAFILYLLIAIVYYFGFFTLYAWIAGGKAGIKLFWKMQLLLLSLLLLPVLPRHLFQSI